MVDVVAALIWEGDRFLACQRPAHKARGLLWEFVGGKVEPGESLQEALIRECREELDVTVGVGEIFMELIHEYPDITVRLILFNAFIADGVPQKLEHNDIRWITTAEIDDYAFCPADDEILKRLKTIDNGIQAELLSCADEKYKAFQSGLMPTVDRDRVIGVRMPILRNLAKRIVYDPAAYSILEKFPHKYYEEDNLYGLLISSQTEYHQTIRMLDAFLPYIDNWATCDLIAPKSFKSHPNQLITKIQQWISSSHPYAVRFGISVLMKYYLGSEFRSEYLQYVADVRSEEYYVKMMIAWYFATALALQYDASVPYLKNKKLDPWVHNKTIQKAIESNRISENTKEFLKTLRK